MNRTALTMTGKESALPDAFLQNTGDILFYFSSSGVIEKVSEPAADFFGGSFLQLLQRKFRDMLDATAHQYIDFAVIGSFRMKKLVNDLLEYARVDTNSEDFYTIDMGAVVNDVLRDFKTTAEKRMFKVGFMPWVKGYKTQLTQLMNNLIGNALKYNKSEKPDVEIGYIESDTNAKFYVKDNGIGIEEKYLEKVFVIFQRLHTRSEFPGTGIGLSICRKIV